MWSIFSYESLITFVSMISVLAVLSSFSLLSVGSAFSVGSAGSAFSIGSVGSFMSIGCINKSFKNCWSSDANGATVSEENGVCPECQTCPICPDVDGDGTPDNVDPDPSNIHVPNKCPDHIKDKCPFGGQCSTATSFCKSKQGLCDVRTSLNQSNPPSITTDKCDNLDHARQLCESISGCLGFDHGSLKSKPNGTKTCRFFFKNRTRIPLKTDLLKRWQQIAKVSTVETDWIISNQTKEDVFYMTSNTTSTTAYHSAPTTTCYPRAGSTA